MKDSILILILLFVFLFIMNSKKKVIEKHNPVFTCGKKYKTGSSNFMKCAQCHQGKYSMENPCPEHDQYDKKRALTAVETAAGIKIEDTKKVVGIDDDGNAILSGVDDSYENIDTTITQAPLQGYATDSEDNASETSSQASTTEEDDNDTVSGVVSGGNQASVNTGTTSTTSTTSSNPMKVPCDNIQTRITNLEPTSDNYVNDIDSLSKSYERLKC